MRALFAGREGEGFAHFVALHGNLAQEYTLFSLVGGENGHVISPNVYEGIPDSDAAFWRKYIRLFSFVRRCAGFGIFRETRKAFLSEVLGHFVLRMAYRDMHARGFGRHFIDYLGKQRKPLLTTEPFVAFLAEEFGYPSDIYLLLSEASLPRFSLPLRAQKGRIRYLASTSEHVRQLHGYGVDARNIFFTGSPLFSVHKEAGRVLHEQLLRRCEVLDPRGAFLHWSSSFLAASLGDALSDLRARRATPVHVGYFCENSPEDISSAEHFLRIFAPDILQGRLRVTFFGEVQVRDAFSLSEIAVRLKLDSFLTSGVLSFFVQEHTIASFSAGISEMYGIDVFLGSPSFACFFVTSGTPFLLYSPKNAQEIDFFHWTQRVGAGCELLKSQDMRDQFWSFLESGMLARMAWMGYMHTVISPSLAIEQILRGKSASLSPFSSLV